MTTQLVADRTDEDRPSPVWMLLPSLAVLALIVLVSIAIAMSAGRSTPPAEPAPGAPEASPVAVVMSLGG